MVNKTEIKAFEKMMNTTRYNKYQGELIKLHKNEKIYYLGDGLAGAPHEDRCDNIQEISINIADEKLRNIYICSFRKDNTFCKGEYYTLVYDDLEQITLPLRILNIIYHYGKIEVNIKRV